jgi:hypothetical protein
MALNCTVSVKSVLEQLKLSLDRSELAMWIEQSMLYRCYKRLGRCFISLDIDSYLVNAFSRLYPLLWCPNNNLLTLKGRDSCLRSVATRLQLTSQGMHRSFQFG